MKKIPDWLPRILSILLIVFLSMFALDVFGQPEWFLALLIHLIPTYLLIAITAVAWKNETIGGWLFLVAGLALLIFTRFETWVIAVPAFMIGFLFLAKKR